MMGAPNQHDPPIGRRVSIVGATGSGKTYVARQLSEKLSVPHVELDRLKASANGEFAAEVARAVDQGTWIIDGHYRDVRNIILERADTIIWLNYPLHTIAKHLIGRLARRKVPRRTKEPGDTCSHLAHTPATWSQRLERARRTLHERREYRNILTSPELADSTLLEFTTPAMTRIWLDALSAQANSVAGLQSTADHDALGRVEVRPEAKPVLFELFSSPGAGKSTCVRAVCQSLEILGRKDLSKQISKAGFYLKRPYLRTVFETGSALAGAARLIARSNLFNRESITRIFRLCLKSAYVQRQKGPYLLDQGCLQEIWSSFVAARKTAADPEALSVLLSKIYANTRTIIIYLDIDPAEAARRISERAVGNSRLDKLDRATAASELARARHLPGTIVEAARRVGLEVIVLDATRPTMELCDQVKAIISRTMGSNPTPTLNALANDSS